VSPAGLVPVAALTRDAGLRALVDKHLSVPQPIRARTPVEITSLVAGMVAGADSIDDIALLHHGGMGKVFDACWSPSYSGVPVGP